MRRKVPLRDEAPTLDSIAMYYQDSSDSLGRYFSLASAEEDQRFIGYSPKELIAEHDERISELELSTAFSVLALVEALFQTDYLRRAEMKKKDPLSRQFRKVYRKRRDRASFGDDILEGWKQYEPSVKGLMGELRSALRFRHWYAHGRYWNPKLGNQKYDFDTMRYLALLVINSVPFDDRDA